MNDAVDRPETEDSEDAAGERIAKVLARAGLGSRRDAEKMIDARRVAINGSVLTSPAVNVLPGDVVSVDGEPLRAAQETRLWRYHKPAGLVTTHKDPQGRTTVFSVLPREMPHVVSVGRLDLNSEGLLLLTNDGALAGTLEHPSTGWPRRYRVRMHGRVEMAKLESLANGIEVDGVQYGPIQVTFERQQGANAWLQVTLHEGKNREIRRVMEHLGYKVNRLIRVSYGPFVIGRLQKGQVEEVPFKVLREALSGLSKGVPDELQMDKINSAKWAKAKPRPVRPGYKKVFRAGSDSEKPEGDTRDTRAQRPRPPFHKDNERQDGERQGGPRQDGFRKDGPHKDSFRKDGPSQDGERRGGPRSDGFRKDGPHKDSFRKDGPSQDGERRGGPRSDGFRKDGPHKDGFRKDGPSQDGERRGDPRSDGFRKDGPRKDGFRKDGPSQDGERRGGPRSDGFRKDGPRKDGFRKDGPSQDGERRGGPRSDGFRKDGPRKDGFRKDGPSQDGPRPSRPQDGPRPSRPQGGPRPSRPSSAPRKGDR